MVLRTQSASQVGDRETLHAKVGTIKDRNGMDLTETEDIKKMWQQYTEELCKKDLYDPDNHDGVVIHLEPYILECEVKWALGTITMNKASRGNGIPVELFQMNFQMFKLDLEKAEEPEIKLPTSTGSSKKQ